MLHLDGLHKRFGDVVALDGCTLQVSPGQMLGFLGPNGAGKTTAMRTVFGLVRPDAGTVTWKGRPMTTSMRRRFGYMPEERGLYPKMPVREQLVYLGEIHGLERMAAEASVDRWLEVFGLSSRSGARVNELSHGNQQRVQLAAALVHDPDLLVLDEPFAGLDPVAAGVMAGILQEQAQRGVAVLFSSHQLDVVEDLCEDVAIIDHGRIVLDGRVSTLRAASPRRYLEVVAPGCRAGWEREVPGATLVARRDDMVRIALDEDVDLASLAQLATSWGLVTRFAYEPPELSEVFREAVAP